MGFFDKFKEINVKKIKMLTLCILFFSSSWCLGAGSSGSNAKSVYREPTIHSAVVCILPAGSKGVVSISKPIKYSNKLWQKISWKDTKGWIMLKKLKDSS